MKKKKGQALKVSKDPNAFISPWMCHLFWCQIDSNICKAKNIQESKSKKTVMKRCCKKPRMNSFQYKPMGESKAVALIAESCSRMLKILIVVV